jgi:hypothetical protein
MASRKPKFQKYQISAIRRGVMEFDTAYNAPDAARIAAKRARKGWRVKVQNAGSGSFTKTKTYVYMTCAPHTTGSKTVARCTLKPAFKKQIHRRKR